MRVEDKTYSLIQNTSEQRRKAPCVAMARSSAEMCHGLERSKFANKKQQDIFNRAEFRNSEWEFCLGWAVERAEFRPKTGSSRSSLGIPLSEFSSDEACCSAAITAQMGFFLSHLVVCVHTSSFSFAVVVTTPNRRVMPPNTLAYQ